MIEKPTENEAAMLKLLEQLVTSFGNMGNTVTDSARAMSAMADFLTEVDSRVQALERKVDQ